MNERAFEILYIGDDGGPWIHMYKDDQSHIQISPKFSEIFDNCCRVPTSSDGTFSGVIADWIDDHPDHFIGDRKLVQKFANWFRKRFNNEKNNEVPVS